MMAMGIGSIPAQRASSVLPVVRLLGTTFRCVSLSHGNSIIRTEGAGKMHTYTSLIGGVSISNPLRLSSCGCTVNKALSWEPQAIRFYSAAKPKPSRDKALQEAPDTGGGAVTLSTAEKVKENVKTASYGGVIVVGVTIGAAMLYFVLNELFSSESPNNIYTQAFKLCKLSTEVQDALGTPIKCYGEETRRGWRRHVAFQEFLDGDTKLLRMRFYIEGPFKKGTVNLEKKTNEKGKYLYTYLIVDVDGYPPRTIHVPF